MGYAYRHNEKSNVANMLDIKEMAKATIIPVRMISLSLCRFAPCPSAKTPIGNMASFSLEKITLKMAPDMAEKTIVVILNVPENCNFHAKH